MRITQVVLGIWFVFKLWMISLSVSFYWKSSVVISVLWTSRAIHHSWLPLYFMPIMQL